MNKMSASLMFCAIMLSEVGVAQAYSFVPTEVRMREGTGGFVQVHQTGQWHEGRYTRYYSGKWFKVVGRHWFAYYYGKYGYGQPCIKCINNPPRVP